MQDNGVAQYLGVFDWTTYPKNSAPLSRIKARQATIEVQRDAEETEGKI